MNNKLKMALPFVLASLALTSSAVASDSLKPNGCEGPTLCHMYPEVDSNRLYVDIGFLLEQMRVTGTDFAYSVDSTFNVLPQDGNVLRPKFNLEWGVTAGIGYHFDHDDWFLRLSFDWLKATGKKNASSTWSQRIVPTGVWKTDMLAGANVTSFNNASASLKINYYDLVADLNKGVYFSGCFGFEPHAGLKAAWIFYDNNIGFTDGSQDAPNDLRRTIKDNFWGIGPNFGFDVTYFLVEGFDLFLDNQIAILFGNASVSDEVTYSANTTTYRTFIKDGHLTMSPTARVLLGVAYCKSVYCDQQHIRLRAALDTNYYWNQYNHINAMYDGVTYSFMGSENNSFGMIGLLVDFAWEF